MLGFRPGWTDLGRAVLASAAYIAVVMPIAIALGANYDFVGNPQDLSEIPPFVAALGPWPRRAVVLATLVPVGFVVVLLPWVIVRRRSASTLARLRERPVRVERSDARTG